MWTIPGFTQEVTLITHIYKWYANRTAELNAIATALGTDTTTHSREMQAPPTPLNPGLTPPAHSRFTNAVNLIVNRGKSGNLTAAAMGTAITNALGTMLPPANTVAPAVTGTATVGSTLTCTSGTWTGASITYAYQWQRAPGGAIAGATNTTYVLVAADSGHSVTCVVRASNPGGSTLATSNAVSVP
jgi:hypothetical protein